MDEDQDCIDISSLNHLCSDLDGDSLADEDNNFTLVTNEKRLSSSRKKKTNSSHTRPITLKLK